MFSRLEDVWASRKLDLGRLQEKATSISLDLSRNDSSDTDFMHMDDGNLQQKCVPQSWQSILRLGPRQQVGQVANDPVDYVRQPSPSTVCGTIPFKVDISQYLVRNSIRSGETTTGVSNNAAGNSFELPGRFFITQFHRGRSAAI